MSSPAPLGGASPAGRVLGPALDKIIKNAAWRKHAALVSASKSALDLLAAASPPDLSSPDADALLLPLSLALAAAAPKVAEPALDCAHKLLSLRLLDLSPAADTPASRLLSSVCACTALADDALELSMLRVLLAAVRSSPLHAEPLVQIVKSCYNVYLGSHTALNQVCAKVSLFQIITIVYARVEADAVGVRVPVVSIADMLDLSDKSLNDASLVQAAQRFINEAMEGWEDEVFPAEEAAEEADGLSKVREDGLFLFKNLCKLSMKFSTAEEPEDHLMLRGKVLSLELLKMVIDNAGPLWRSNERHVQLQFTIRSSYASEVHNIHAALCP